LIGTVTENQKNTIVWWVVSKVFLWLVLHYFTFIPSLNSDTNPDAWLNVYWLLAAIFFLYVFIFC
jgi:hypothetical protein